jgi:cbb3-type cytochrome oxidase subunit 3
VKTKFLCAKKSFTGKKKLFFEIHVCEILESGEPLFWSTLFFSNADTIFVAAIFLFYIIVFCVFPPKRRKEKEEEEMRLTNFVDKIVPSNANFFDINSPTPRTGFGQARRRWIITEARTLPSRICFKLDQGLVNPCCKFGASSSGLALGLDST